MKLTALLAAVVVASVSFAFAADDAKPAHKPFDGVRGKITKVDGASITVSTMNRETKETKDVVVATDDKTVVKIDGKEAKVADLKADMFVKITPATGTAATVDAFTKMPSHKPKGDAPAAPAETK